LVIKHFILNLCLLGSGLALVAGCMIGANTQDYPEAHPPVGQQPRRPAGYEPFHYPKSPEELLRTETPGFLKRAHKAWKAAEVVVRQGPYRAQLESLGTHPCPEWFLDAKFGMFIDWGPWSVAGWAPQNVKATYPDWYENKLLKEYRDYHVKTWGADIQPDDLIQLMRSSEFRAERFTELAQAAGMRYVVPFLKHHGGYCLWNSSFTHRNSAEWGLKRDFAAELSRACRAAGLRYGAYVSLGEWNYPVIKNEELWTVTLRLADPTNHLIQMGKLTAGTPFVSGKVPVKDYARDYLIPSLKELIDHTNPDMLWFDGDWETDARDWRSPELAAYFYDRAKSRGQDVCINDRFGLGTRGVPGWGDFFTSEFHEIRGFQAHPWEENRSLSHSYGYNWEESFDDRYVLSEGEALDLLLRIVSNGGNLLLMVSPDGSGRIPPNQERRLRFLGRWLAKYGEAIYATRPLGLNRQPDWGYLTRSKNSDRLFCIVRRWPADGLLHVPVTGDVRGAHLLGGNVTPAVKTEANGLTVDLAGIQPPDKDASVVLIDVEHGLNIENATPVKAAALLIR
jgi:alpha-L-fucosidase